MTASKLIALACLLALAHARSITKPNFELSTLTSRIIGGKNAKRGDFPHQVSLQAIIPGALPYTHFCGGSILNNQWILTAAHCVAVIETPEDPQMIFAVVAGKHDLTTTEDTEQTAFIEDFFIHEEYERKPEAGVGPFDIGLIKLRKPLRLNKYVSVISLPQPNSDPAGESQVILSGWGAVDNSTASPEMPYILQTADLQIVGRRACNTAINKLHEEAGEPLPYDLVDDTNICSGPITGGLSACGGDSGGPLITKDSSGNLQVVGIVSWGLVPCGIKDGPSVYTRTSYFIDWIADVMKANN